MPRDVGGTYTLPAGNPVVTATTITSTWANTTLDDIATALTASLSIDGSVTAAKLATNSVTTVKIADLNVTAAKLAADAVTTAKILDANVTTSKLADDAVTYAKMQNVSATDKLLGRSTAGAGDVEEITCTAAGRAILDDADASAQRTTLGVAIGTNVQAWDADLDAVAALATTGLLARTGAATYSTRTLTAPAAGITVSDGNGVAGNPTLALANDLAALEALAGTGLAVHTAADTWAERTITGTANKITVTNGDGVAGNPTLTIPDAVTLVTPTVTGLLDCTGGQIKFPAVDVPSADVNTLDDYQEGTWTPGVTYVVAGDSSVTYSSQIGNYTKIGNMVTCEIQLTCSAFSDGTTASGALRITGLPFTVGSNMFSGSVLIQNLTVDVGSGFYYWSLVFKPVSGTTQAEIWATSNGNQAIAISANVAAHTLTTIGGSMFIKGTFTYFV